VSLKKPAVAVLLHRQSMISLHASWSHCVRDKLVCYGLRMAASFYCTQYATFVNWVLVSYTLPNQLNLSPADSDSAL